MESFTEEEDFNNNLDEVSVEDYILVKYATKKTVRHYVGQVKAIRNEEFEVRFLKKLLGSKFVFPDKDDEDFVDKENIILKLPKPFVSGATQRSIRQLSFNLDLSQYNLL